MAVYSGSIYGRLKGASLGVVASSWKGIKYVREYVVPKNPRTPAQTLRRDIFRNVSQLGRRLVDAVLNPYTLPPPKHMSPYNAFVSRNVPRQATSELDYSQVLMMQGPYVGVQDVTGTISDNTVTVTWSTDLIGDAQPDDRIVVVALDPGDGELKVATSTRNAGTIDVVFSDLPMEVEGVHVWVFSCDPELTVSSDSTYALAQRGL